MRRRTVVLSSALAIVLVAGFAGTRAAVPVARPALGFVAKVVCSGVFLGGVTPDQALSDLPDEPIAQLIRARVDTARRSVSASLPLVAKRQAVYREGLGCTLVSPAGPAALPTRISSPADPAALTTRASSPADPTATRALPSDARADRAALWPHGETVDATAAAAVSGIDGARLSTLIEDSFSEPDPALKRRTRAIVIVHGGRIVAERYAEGFGPASRFTGWSMTKSVTNALVGILAGRNALDIDADRLRPEWRSPGDPRAAITLHDLLTMSSGLAFDESYAPTGAVPRMLFDSHDAAATAAASPLAHEPGTIWSYSSGTSNIVSARVRDAFATDDEYLAFPRHALFDRIGMTSAVIEPDPSGTFVGSSFMYATARDWARFGLLFLRDGIWDGERILPAGWVRYSVTPAPAAPEGQYGAHWWLNAGERADTARRTWPDLPRDIYYASGFDGQFVVVVPSHDLVVVRLGVTPDGRAWRLGTFLRGVLDIVENGASR
jgi:CubicO group peptidase (beta-lactamase class C family)